jgi:hypothetical protein
MTKEEVQSVLAELLLGKTDDWQLTVVVGAVTCLVWEGGDQAATTFRDYCIVAQEMQDSSGPPTALTIATVNGQNVAGHPFAQAAEEISANDQKVRALLHELIEGLKPECQLIALCGAIRHLLDQADEEATDLLREYVQVSKANREPYPPEPKPLVQ